jgi:hypothetical protein
MWFGKNRKAKMDDIKILPMQILPTAIYRIKTSDGDLRLRYGAELETDDYLVIAIKNAHRDPKLIAEAVEQFLVQENRELNVK